MSVMDWANLSLGVVAILALAYVVIEKNKSRGPQTAPSGGPSIGAEQLANIIATAVKAAVAEVARPLNEAVTNNTKALHAMELLLAEQNGKLEQVLQARHIGGD